MSVLRFVWKGYFNISVALFCFTVALIDMFYQKWFSFVFLSIVGVINVIVARLLREQYDRYNGIE